MLGREKIERIKALLEKREEIDAAYLYGSQARGNEHTDSDIDIGLLLKEEFKPPARYPVRLALKIEKHTGLENVDLRILNGKNPRFLQNVLTDSRLIFSKSEEHRIDFESTSLVRYLDMKPVFEERKKMMKRRISE